MKKSHLLGGQVPSFPFIVVRLGVEIESLARMIKLACLVIGALLALFDILTQPVSMFSHDDGRLRTGRCGSLILRLLLRIPFWCLAALVIFALRLTLSFSFLSSLSFNSSGIIALVVGWPSPFLLCRSGLIS